ARLALPGGWSRSCGGIGLELQDAGRGLALRRAAAPGPSRIPDDETTPGAVHRSFSLTLGMGPHRPSTGLDPSAAHSREPAPDSFPRSPTYPAGPEAIHGSSLSSACATAAIAF